MKTGVGDAFDDVAYFQARVRYMNVVLSEKPKSKIWRLDLFEPDFIRVKTRSNRA